MKKIFYELEPDLNPKVTGSDYPQCYKFIRKVSLDTPRSIYDTHTEVVEKNRFPDFKPQLSVLKFAGRAKPTDFVSTVVFDSPFVTKHVLSALSDLDFGEHRIYPLRLYYRLSPRLYFYVAILAVDTFKYIQWEKSQFYKTMTAFANSDLDSIYEKKLESIKFHNETEYLDYFRPLEVPQAETLVVSKDFPIHRDYLTLQNLCETFVSKRFIDAVKANNLTGLEFGRKIEIVTEDD